jgi:hypothetical protein
MELINTFSLARHTGEYSTWPLASRLLLQGRDTGTAIKGYALEAQYRWSEGYLLISSWECPFEESNSFTLLDKHFRAMAICELGAMYASFLLVKHWPVSASELRLHYDDKVFYTLRIVEKMGLFKKRLSLELETFESPENDPHALASIQENEKRLQEIGSVLSKDQQLG